ncbi:DUF1269 domain-containing protein [soil metagenome]
MATVTVLKFAQADGAAAGLDRIQALKAKKLIKLYDAVIVSWPRGKSCPQANQLIDLVSLGTAGGLFLGMLIGFVFATPFFGAAVGVAFGALGGAFRESGIDDGFVRRVRQDVTEGTSALFLMTGEAVLNSVADDMKHLEFEILATNLSSDQEKILRDAFGQKFE